MRLQFYFKNNARCLMFPGSDMEEFCCFSSIYVTVHWIFDGFGWLDKTNHPIMTVYWQPLALFTTNIAICTLDYVLPIEGSISSIKHSRSPSPVLAQAWTSLTPTALSDKPTQIASKKYSQRLIVYIPDYILFLLIDSPKSYAHILSWII